jgi:hypothetical protein
MVSTSRVGRNCLLLLIFLVFPFLKLQALQSVWGAAQSGKLQRKPSVTAAPPPNAGEAPKPQLLNADTDPTLRYPVSVNAGGVISCGWLDVTRSQLNYAPNYEGQESSRPAVKKFSSLGTSNYVTSAVGRDSPRIGAQGFGARLSEISIVQFDKSALLIKSATVNVELTYLSQEQWTLAQSRHTFFLLAEQNLAGTTSIQTALRNFESVLAMVKPPALPAVDVTLRAEPASVEKGRSVALVWSSSNATTLDLEPGIGRVAAGGGTSITPQESSNYTLTATGPGGTKTASVFVTVTAPAAPPTLVLMEPSAAGEGQTVEIASSPLIIRGVVMDVSGMPVVTVNGKSVTIRPTSAQAAQFTSDPLALEAGENRVEVIATNYSHGQAKVSFVAHFAPSSPKAPSAEVNNPKGLAKAEIVSLLQGDVPSARVAELVKNRGLKFLPTPDDLKEIRSAGGGGDLIDSINQAAATK